MSKNISDYNSLKNQQKQSDVFKKYKRLLKAKPSTLQEYYYYLQNKQPQLDELNYLSNTQIANAKNEVAKQLENAVILNDKFKANLEADKERVKLESQQRKNRQNEIFAQELFDANTREAKQNLAEKLQGAIRGRKARDEKTYLELDQIKREQAQERMRINQPRMRQIFRANEEYNKNYLKREKAQEALIGFAKEAKQQQASRILQGAARAANVRTKKIMNSNVRDIINKIETSGTIENPKQAFQVKTATEQQLLRQQRPPQLRLTNG